LKINKKKIKVITYLFLAFTGIFSSWYLYRTNSLDPRNLAKLVQNQDTKCTQADISGANNATDGKVNAFDLAIILANWRWQKTPTETKADIWGPQLIPDGEVDMYDLSRILYCWRLENSKIQNICGDGTLGLGEECDPPGSSSQCISGICTASCKCSSANPTSPLPTTGNNQTPVPSLTPTTGNNVTPMPTNTYRPGVTPTITVRPPSATPTPITIVPTATSIPPSPTSNVILGICTCSTDSVYVCDRESNICGQREDPATTQITQCLQTACNVTICQAKLMEVLSAQCTADPACLSIQKIENVTSSWAR